MFVRKDETKYDIIINLLLKFNELEIIKIAA